MSERRKITPFDITRGQKIKFGRYAGLENLLRSYLLDLEGLFYDLLSVPFDVSFEVKEYKNYLEYLDNKRHPLPMFVFEMPPLKGSSLLIMENRFVNMILAREQLKNRKKAVITDDFNLNPENYSEVKPVIEALLSRMCSSWETLIDVDYKLKRLVSHPIKARVLSPNEPCIAIPVKFKWEGFVTQVEFCFSTVQLDPVMNLLSRQSLMVSDKTEKLHPEITQYFDDVLMTLPYALNGSIGSIKATQGDLENSLETGSVLPIQNELGVKISLQVNGENMLAGLPGNTRGSYSVKVEDTLQELLEKARKDEKSFQELHFNRA